MHAGVDKFLSVDCRPGKMKRVNYYGKGEMSYCTAISVFGLHQSVKSTINFYEGTASYTGSKKQSNGWEYIALTTVLLIDDSRVSRMLTRAVIARRFPDWLIVEAASGEEALEIAEGKHIDVMLIDLNMYGMDGFRAAELLRGNHPESRISLLTANIQDTVQERARASGIGFISKPINEDRITAFLAAGEVRCSP
jgi:CheY-like chemotaxis protein